VLNENKIDYRHCKVLYSFGEKSYAKTPDVDSYANCQKLCEREYDGNLVNIESAEEEKYIVGIVGEEAWVGMF